MKMSKRNIANANAKAEKTAAGKPPMSKYERKRQAQLVEVKDDRR